MIGFQWIVEREMAGASQPGRYRNWADDLDFLRAKGIDYIVSLTEQPLIEEDVSNAGLGFLHFPIRDMDIPMPRDASTAMSQIQNIVANGHVPLLHCKAGVGRTGMLAACYMVTRGYSPKNAITYVRTIQPKYIQTLNQERFIGNFAEYHLKRQFH